MKSDIGSSHIVDQIHKMESSYRVINKHIAINQSQKDYIDALIKYKLQSDSFQYRVINKMNPAVTIFDDPLSFFFIDKNTLHCIFFQPVIIKNVEEFFANMNYIYIKDVSEDLIKKIKNYINHNTFARSLKAIRKYEKSHSRPFNVNLDSLIIIDGNLCYNRALQNSRYISNENQPALFQYDLLAKVFKEDELPTLFEAKQIFNNIRRSKLKSNITSNLIDNKKAISVIYPGYQVFYDEDKEKLKYKLNESYSSKIKYYTFKNGYQIDYLPENLISILYKLTNGSITRLKLISNLVLSMLSEKPVSKKIIIFKMSQEQFSALRKLITKIWGDQIIDFSLKELCDRKNHIKLIEYKLENRLLNICKDGPTPPPEKLLWIKKLIQCKPISFPEKLMGKVSFINSFAYIYNTEYEDRIVKLMQLVPSIIYDFSESRLSDDDVENLDLPRDETVWMNTVFPLYALVNKFGKPNSFKKEEVNTEKSFDPALIKNFIYNYCIRNKSVICYADKLYKAYSSFINNSFRLQPLTRIKFVKELKSYKMFRYGRPHFSAKESNKYAFYGLDVDYEKLNTIEQDSPTPAASDEDVFRTMFIAMNNEIPQDLRKIFKKKVSVKKGN